MDNIIIVDGHEVRYIYQGIPTYVVLEDCFVCWSRDDLLEHFKK